MSDTIYSLPGATFYTELDNAPTGLVGTVGVRLIRKSDEATVIARTVAGIIESPAGSGRYKATLKAPDDQGAYTVFWDTGAVSPSTTASDDLVVTRDLPDAGGAAFPGYPSTAELVAASSNEQLKELSGPEQDALRSIAIINVEGYTGQSFVAEGTEEAPVTRLVAGTGSRELYLPRRLEQLVSVSIPSGGITASDVQIDAEEHNRIFLERVGSSTWVERAMRETNELVFPRGADQVTIAGVWGWAECPAAVVTALRFDMEDAASAESSELAPSLRAWRKLGMGSMAQGPLSVQLADRPLVLSPRAADTLDTAGMVWADVGEVV